MSTPLLAARNVLSAQAAAAEAKVLAEHMREAGAWFAHAELVALAEQRLARAERIRAIIRPGVASA